MLCRTNQFRSSLLLFSKSTTAFRYMSTEKKQRNPSLSTDAIVIRKSDDNKNEILLIERKNNPFKGKLAFPGGFVDNGEDPEVACVRELKEETNLVGETPPHLIAVAGDPNRDPRSHVVSVVYAVKVKKDNLKDLQFGDDAAKADFMDLDDVLKNKEMAFDHKDILVKKFMPWFEEKGEKLLFN